ncbi:hypothetical protein Rxyl_0498 [Rubrobacter xylanophilus DSM 9941]|uniref:Uncharacterized protein n=1 Tax=Rubrobacter xylanophilus (strain DSM 9941 / JCM 11954 / NBRC 16129 / PRD-1) TaxID=266117 RepID=Q1AYQ6_RUBXD|nr:hypothetical protein [Rubrobacter xylanophilus]ABG03472.1 hypothetical protein Rxyl_0498 [Rubrobacter xylanophilus DSM 9941]
MAAPPKPWSPLSARLEGRFAARGLPPLGFSLLEAEGPAFGRLRPEGGRGARISAAGALVVIEREGRGRYRMLWEGVQALSAEGPPEGFRIAPGGEPWEAGLRLLRNFATARGPGGRARVEGDLAGLRYGARFEGEAGLPAALFLLYRLAAARSRAFVVGGR